MEQLDQFIKESWFRTEGSKKIEGNEDAEKSRLAIVKAEEKAVSSLWDLPFAFNIALAEKNIDRNDVGAENILTYYKKEIEPAFEKLDEPSKLICELDWIIIFYRALDTIRHLPHVRADRDTSAFVKKLDLSARFRSTVSRFRELASAHPEVPLLSSFGIYLSRAEEELVKPNDLYYNSQSAFSRTLGVVKTAAAASVAALILFVIISVTAAVGPVAKMLGIHHPRLVSADSMSDLGTYDAVPIADFNASSVLSGENDRWSDSHLMDGSTETVWAEGESNAGIEKRLYFNIDKKADVHYIVIYNGDQETGESYSQYNRLKTITVRLDSASKSYKVRLKDTADPQYIRIDANIDRLWLIIDSVYKGTNKENTTCVSEVEIY